MNEACARQANGNRCNNCLFNLMFINFILVNKKETTHFKFEVTSTHLSGFSLDLNRSLAATIVVAMSSVCTVKLKYRFVCNIFLI